MINVAEVYYFHDHYDYISLWPNFRASPGNLSVTNYQLITMHSFIIHMDKQIYEFIFPRTLEKLRIYQY